MKSFNQFLQESYLNEELPPGMDRATFNRLPAKSKRKLTGSDVGLGREEQPLQRPKAPNYGGNSRTAVLNARKSGTVNTSPGTGNSNKLPIPNPPKPQGTTTTVSGSSVRGETGNSGTSGRYPKPSQSAAASAAKEAEKTAAKTATKTAGKGILKGLGKVAGPAAAALDVADERAKGSGWLRSLAKGATVAAGGALGGAAGTAAGPVGTFVGATGGSIAASKAFDVAAGKNARERAADRLANRQKQAGGAIKGIGGKTTFDTKKNTITTGTGPQKRTAQLAKTSVITGPGGKQEVGHLAYKGGKAVYKRAAATGSDDGIIARFRRFVDPSGAKQSDAANAARNLATARQNDANRQKALGVKFSPGK